ncbi:MAG: thiamine phosphate synthase [Nitrospirota bacterium]
MITDRHATRGRPLPDVVSVAVSAGPCAIQLREKDLPTRELLELARSVRERTAQARVPLLINDRLDICWAAEADGVHLRRDSLPTRVARRLLGSSKLIGVSAHSLEEILQAEQEGADFALFGPVYATPSKLAYGPPQGLAALEAAARRTRLPVFAVGGVTAERVSELIRAGARGVGLISAVFGAEDARRAAADVMHALQRAL